MAGDHNAHHGLWNNTRKVSNQGIIIADIINDSDLCILIDGSFTCEKNYKNRIYKLAIDITLVTPDIAGLTNCERIEEFIGSDHFPIITTISGSGFKAGKVSRESTLKRFMINCHF